MRQFLWFSAFMLVISAAAVQANTPPKAAAKKPNQARVSAKEVQELRVALEAQQRQLQEQNRQMEQLKFQVQQLLDVTQQANASAQKVQGSA